MLSLIEVEWSVIIEKHLGPLRVKFNTKQTPLNLSEVESKFIEKRHVNHIREAILRGIVEGSLALRRGAACIGVGERWYCPSLSRGPDSRLA